MPTLESKEMIWFCIKCGDSVFAAIKVHSVGVNLSLSQKKDSQHVSERTLTFLDQFSIFQYQYQSVDYSVNYFLKKILKTSLVFIT